MTASEPVGSGTVIVRDRSSRWRGKVRVAAYVVAALGFVFAQQSIRCDADTPAMVSLDEMVVHSFQMWPQAPHEPRMHLRGGTPSFAELDAIVRLGPDKYAFEQVGRFTQALDLIMGLHERPTESEEFRTSCDRAARDKWVFYKTYHDAITAMDRQGRSLESLRQDLIAHTRRCMEGVAGVRIRYMRTAGVKVVKDEDPARAAFVRRLLAYDE